MKLLKIWRTFKEGLKNFSRHRWLSLATIIILALSLYVVVIPVFLGLAGNSIIKNIQNKMNISVYFNPEVSEEEILEIKNDLKAYREIKSVEYISQNQALDEFLASENNDPIITQALEEIGENPLLSSLAITAYKPNQYEIITQAIESSNFRDKINKINYKENKKYIEDINEIVTLVKKAGLVLGFILLLTAELITFNTIRLNMYSRKKEFEIMRLVGASNLYIQMPSIFEGIFYGIGAAAASMVLLFLTIKVMAPLTQELTLLAGILVASFQLYFQYFWIIFAGITALGVALGIASSFIAIRRYLKI